MRVLPTLFLRAALPLLLLGLLSGCAVYDTVFHPHRLPTPKMDAATKAKVKAAEKARHKGLSLKAADEPGTNATATDGGDSAAPSAGAGDEKKKTMSYSDLPEGTRIKYDKQGLVKKSMLDRMANNGHKLHHYDTRPLTPREASRENRKLRKKGHSDHSKGAPADKAKKEPLDPALDTGPDPGPPVASPASEPAAPAKGKKAAPKPDPTQPAPAPAPQPAKPKQKASKTPVPKPDPTQPAPGQ
ncbi:MAG: hypothetical protein ACRYF0_15575 [Janthinobacterium lividum]